MQPSLATTLRYRNFRYVTLGHLSSVGVNYAPGVVGRDEQGREVLTYIEGEDSGSPLIAPLLSDNGVFVVARVASALQKALAACACPEDAGWQFCTGRPRSGQMLQHGDLGPWKMIWESNQVAGIIDWDFVHPGDNLYDIAHLAWFVVPFMDD
jgi:hypothetical protein